MQIVTILGSPTVPSRSGSLLHLAESRLSDVLRDAASSSIAIRDLPAEALLQAQIAHPSIRHALGQVAAADLVLIATPIYQAAYSGALKAFLDLLPQDGLRGKTVLPLATGGSLAHLLALEYALKPVLSALGARDILDPVFATEAHIVRHPTLGYVPLPELAERIDRSLAPMFERYAGSSDTSRFALSASSIASRVSAGANAAMKEWT